MEAPPHPTLDNCLVANLVAIGTIHEVTMIKKILFKLIVLLLFITDRKQNVTVHSTLH